jgi:hypothetical protein
MDCYSGEHGKATAGNGRPYCLTDKCGRTAAKTGKPLRKLRGFAVSTRNKSYEVGQ